MKAPAEYDGFEQHSTWNLTEVDAPRLLRYVHRLADADGNRISPAEAGIPDGVPSGGHHEVELTDLENGRTLLEMTEHGYTTAEARDLSLAGLDSASTRWRRSSTTGRGSRPRGLAGRIVPATE